MRACTNYSHATSSCAELMASKRKRSIMCLEKKLDKIVEIQQGKSQRAVVNRFGVAKSTVGNIWKDRDTCNNEC